MGVWKSRNPESGIRNWSRKWKRNRNLNLDQSKLGSTETSSLYPCGNKIQDGVLCYHCFEKFSAQWSLYQRYTHIRKVTCKEKGKCILLLFLAVINCDCSCRSNNFQQIETTTNQKPIDCEKKPLLVCDVCYSFPSSWFGPVAPVLLSALARRPWNWCRCRCVFPWASLCD